LRTLNIACSADQIFIFNNSGSAVESICRLLLNPGDSIAVEEPGFGGIKNIAKYQQLELAPIPIDSEGLIVSELRQLPKPPKLVYVTSISHDPTGIAMSLKRRQELLAWAKENNAWIMDDSFDGYFKHGKSETPSLYSLDSNSVIHVSTFWQILFPLTTVSYTIVPLPLIDVLKKSTAHNQGLIETVIHDVLADMLNDGYLQKHLRKWGRIFGARLRSFTHEAKLLLGDKVTIQKQSGGLNCLVSFHLSTDQTILAAAKASELPLAPISSYYLGQPKRGEFVVNFAALPEETMSKRLKKFVRLILC
jgi:GntR family transcriptional regulator/MocR family aminotransferase